jgi:hypothetical protein
MNPQTAMNISTNAIAETVTLQVPSQAYARAKQAAGKNPQMLEQLLVSALLSGLSLLDDLPDDLVMDMATLALLNDSALWRIARETMPDDHYQRMDQLLSVKKQGKFSSLQQEQLDEYLAEYDTIILRRAHAAVLLQQRGYDLSNPQILANSSPRLA